LKLRWNANRWLRLRKKGAYSVTGSASIGGKSQLSGNIASSGGGKETSIGVEELSTLAITFSVTSLITSSICCSVGVPKMRIE
jgi:hypothetical protein